MVTADILGCPADIGCDARCGSSRAGGDTLWCGSKHRQLAKCDTHETTYERERSNPEERASVTSSRLPEETYNRRADESPA